MNNHNHADDCNECRESGLENIEDLFANQEDEDEAPLRRKFPAWLIAFISLLVLVSFLAFSMPDLSLFIGQRFDFLSQNTSLGDDPLVLAARDTVASITAMGIEGAAAQNRAGTGFLISADGKILTNLHVVDKSSKIKVELKNGDVYYAHKYLPMRDLDVAVIDIDAADLPYLRLNTESLPKVNDFVTAVGNPLGFRRIAARGAIKGYTRIAGKDQIMEIDLSTKPGSSGSPVINNNGEAVAIVFAILTQDENQETKSITLAIPLHLLAQELKDVVGK